MTKIFKYNIDASFDYENGFYLTSDVSSVGKLLAYYELYKHIMDLPGHVIELGVFKGASLLRFATFMTLMESPFSRKIIGFDTFGAPPLLGDAVDRSFAESGQTDPDNGIPKAELEHCLQYKGIRSCELIAGDIKQTLPDYVQKNPALKVSLLHIDTELYESAAIGLDLLWDKIVPGGLLVLDDYGTEAGGTRAVDEFFAGQDVRIRKLPISQTCPSYIRKR